MIDLDDLISFGFVFSIPFFGPMITAVKQSPISCWNKLFLATHPIEINILCVLKIIRKLKWAYKEPVWFTKWRPVKDHQLKPSVIVHLLFHCGDALAFPFFFFSIVTWFLNTNNINCWHPLENQWLLISIYIKGLNRFLLIFYASLYDHTRD